MDDDDTTGSSSSSSSSPLHIVICPWLAFGHLLPCLDLASRLASRGHRVSLVSTPRNLARLPPVPPAVAPLVDLVSLPLASVHGLPAGAESTHDLPHDMFELHRQASDGLAAPFADFLKKKTTKPDWIVADYFNPWAAAAANEHDIPCAMLVLLAATAVAADEIRLSMGPAALKDASRRSILERIASTLDRCELVAMRSCVEWEPEAVPLVPTFRGKPVVPFGLLPPSPDGSRRRDDAGAEDDDAAARWLDAQPANSVVYVALGSEVPLRAEQVHELALGLGLAGPRFLWALRKPVGVPDAAAILPPNFHERTRDRGLVVTGWVHQLSILSHGAVAAFLTHCGWNSTIEGLMFGRPLIMLPIIDGGDQGPNARLMEGKKVGVRVARDGDDGSFRREGVAAAIRAVAVEEEGRRVFAANAKRMQEIVADRECHERYIDSFIQRLRSHKQER